MKFTKKLLVTLLLLLSNPAFSADGVLEKKEGSEIRMLTDEYVFQMQRLDPFYDYTSYAKRPGKEFGNEFDPANIEKYTSLIVNTHKQFKKIKSTAKTEIDKDTAFLFEDSLNSSLKGIKNKEFSKVIRVFSISHLWNRVKAYGEMGAGYSSFPFEEFADFDNYIERSAGIKKWVDSYIAATQEVNKKGYFASRQNIEFLIADLESLAVSDIKKSRFYMPVTKIDRKKYSKEQISTLEKKYSEAIEKTIYPEINRVVAFLKSNMKNTKPEFGLYGLKNGLKIYEQMKDESIDHIGLKAETLHELGLAEVEKNIAKMNEIKVILGHGKMSFTEFIKFYQQRPESYFTKKEDMEAAFRDAEKLVNAKINDYFSMVPTTPLQLRGIDNPKSPAASYSGMTETLDKAYFNYNSADLKSTTKMGTHTLYIHEGNPGHHFQLSTNFDLKKKLGKFRGEMYGSNAFIEGWALYAEYLGREMGIYKTPEHQLGNLNDDMMRSVRLVVDTGIHYKGWSREKAIQYMSEHLTEDISGVTTEIDRYSVWQGQALGYKVGQLEILRLRQEAEKKLGAKFNIKDFHKVVLESGNINLKLLQDKVATWLKK
jgi:uncharacterized protein (DUF885 family)